jgi:hypothetical protein
VVLNRQNVILEEAGQSNLFFAHLALEELVEVESGRGERWGRQELVEGESGREEGQGQQGVVEGQGPVITDGCLPVVETTKYTNWQKCIGMWQYKHVV